MKTNILIYTFILFSLGTNAQQLLVSTNFSAQQGKINEEIDPSVLVKNNSTHSMELRWERVRNNLPQGWESVVDYFAPMVSRE